MGLRVDVDDLVSAAEIARRLEITRQAVDQWTGKRDFPEPVWTSAGDSGRYAYRLWLWSEVEPWREAMQEVRAAKPEFTHGASAYRRRICRCDVCHDASLTLYRKNAAERAERLKADPTLAPHGNIHTYTNWRCRCAECRAVWSVHMKEQRERRRQRRQAERA